MDWRSFIQEPQEEQYPESINYRVRDPFNVRAVQHFFFQKVQSEARWTMQNTFPAEIDSLACFGTFLMLGSSGVVLATYSLRLKSASAMYAAWSIVYGASLMLAWAIIGKMHAILLVLSISIPASVAATAGVPLLTAFGKGLVAVRVTVSVLVAAYGCLLLRISGVTPSAMAVLSVFFLPIMTIMFLLSISERILILGRLTLKTPRRAEALRLIEQVGDGENPKVSIHVPTYAEPPEILEQTLHALSCLEYDNFEVLVIDNNTKNPDLWKPVEACCAKLGSRFRFFHVDPISGAKAGALNFALRHADKDAELIAIVDADYVAEPDFLRKLVPLFQEPRVGFVQTTHEYREWKGTWFLARFYDMYVLAHKLIYPALSELNAAFTVGTMCIIRRRAIEEAGGWAEWCQTEDSELSVRLYAIGYCGYYFWEASGRGLIPETMERIRKQQFRWTYGPTQYMKKHFLLYLGKVPGRKLSTAQSLLFFRSGLEKLPTLLGPLAIAPFLLVAYCDIRHGTEHHAGIGIILFVLSCFFAKLIESWAALNFLGKRSLIDTLIFQLASLSVNTTQTAAFVFALIGVKRSWYRTNKFPPSYSFMRGMLVSWFELLLAAVCLIAALLLSKVSTFSPLNYAALLTLFLSFKMLRFLSTVGMSLLCEIELWAEQRARI